MLFIQRIEDEVIIADVQGNIYGIGYNHSEAIEDAIDSGVDPLDVEGLCTFQRSETSIWDDDEEDYL